MNLYFVRNIPNPKQASFTLVELLVVVSIIGLLAGLGFPAVNGALKAGKKAEVSSMAEQIKTALNAFYSEYSAYPTNAEGLVFSNTSKEFFDGICTTNATCGNSRGIVFLEVSPKFTNSDGIVTPTGFAGSRSNFFVLIDINNAGFVNPSKVSSVTNTNVPSSVAVWVMDPSITNKPVGTFK
jgi:prepilin-type N-terminal cleavage/methylation domain-containing protein